MDHNTLSSCLKETMPEAKIDATSKSNHSLRATAISCTYHKDVPEKLIMERSSHLSREGLASYEHTTPAQQKAGCSTLSSAWSSFFGANTNTTSQTSHTPEVKLEHASDNGAKEEASEMMKEMLFTTWQAVSSILISRCRLLGRTRDGPSGETLKVVCMYIHWFELRSCQFWLPSPLIVNQKVWYIYTTC